MTKQKSNVSKMKIFLLIIAIILISLIITALVIFIPGLLGFLLGKLLSSNDGYLLTGFSFCICGSILIVLIPIIIFLLVSNKKNRINDLKKHKTISIIIILIVIFFEIAVSSRGYTYYKDIKEGSKEVIMMDSVVKREYVYKNSHNTYITGYINGEKSKLEITRDARSKVSRNKKYKMVKIKYYKHIKEVFDIDIYVSYKEDK